MTFLYSWHSHLSLTLRHYSAEVQSIFSIYGKTAVSWRGLLAACCLFLECYTNLPFCLLLIVGFCTVNVEKRLMLVKRSVREDCECNLWCVSHGCIVWFTRCYYWHWHCLCEYLVQPLVLSKLHPLITLWRCSLCQIPLLCCIVVVCMLC